MNNAILTEQDLTPPAIPAWEQASIDAKASFEKVLTELGITCTATPVAARPDGLMSDPEHPMSHAHFIVTLPGRRVISGYYSAGSLAALSHCKTLSEFRRAIGVRAHDGHTSHIDIAHAWKQKSNPKNLGWVERILKIARATWTPSMAQVMQSVVQDATPETFEDFCSNLDLDTDSRSALKSFEICREFYVALVASIGPAKLEELQALAAEF